MKNFWKFLLRKSLPTDSLSRLNFVVIGLGDSSYLKFNFVAKRLHKRLIQLGGNALLPMALCDDQHDLGIGAVLFPFMNNLWEKLMNIRPTDKEILKESPRFLRWEVKRIQSITKIDENQDIYSEFEESEKEGYVEVIENVRTTSDYHFQDVRLISFCRCNLTWNVGDVAYIRPKNSPENVKKLFKIFNEHNLQIRPEDIVTLNQFDDGKFKLFFIILFFFQHSNPSSCCKSFCLQCLNLRCLSKFDLL
jgi:sulfite reductase alpha subunit-like flavoprotein